MSQEQLTFDEDDLGITLPLANSVAIVAKSVFPSKLICESVTLSRNCGPVTLIEKSVLSDCLELLDECLGEFYVRHKGQRWKREKQGEMSEPSLVYVWYEDVSGVACFVSFRIVLEPYGRSLYLYEIQVKPLLQGKQLGLTLMNSFHSLAQNLCSINTLYKYSEQAATVSTNDASYAAAPPCNANLSNIKYLEQLNPYKNLPQIVNFSVSGTGLTVFSDNLRAFKWYTQLGYVLAVHSPVDKKLRGGKAIAPDYYILYRPVRHITN